jgi:hypothetical protein
LGTEFHRHGVDGKPMESASTAAAAEGDVRVDLQTTGPMQSTSVGEKSQADTKVSRGLLVPLILQTWSAGANVLETFSRGLKFLTYSTDKLLEQGAGRIHHLRRCRMQAALL